MASAVNGILSNTAETKPSPSAVSQLGNGKDLTGIIDAAETSAMRKSAPRAAWGTTDQSGRAIGVERRMADATASPISGTSSRMWVSRRCAPTLAAIADASTKTTTATYM